MERFLPAGEGLDLASVASSSVVRGLSGGEFGSPRSENGFSVSSTAGTTTSSSEVVKGKSKEEYVDDEVSSTRSTSIASVGNGVGSLGGDGDGGNAALRQNVAAFEGESIDGLERQEISFKLFVQILGKTQLKPEKLERIRAIAARQLKSLPAFLKVNVASVD